MRVACRDRDWNRQLSVGGRPAGEQPGSFARELTFLVGANGQDAHA